MTIQEAAMKCFGHESTLCIRPTNPAAKWHAQAVYVTHGEYVNGLTMLTLHELCGDWEVIEQSVIAKEAAGEIVDS